MNPDMYPTLNKLPRKTTQKSSCFYIKYSHFKVTGTVITVEKHQLQPKKNALTDLENETFACSTPAPTSLNSLGCRRDHLAAHRTAPFTPPARKTQVPSHRKLKQLFPDQQHDKLAFHNSLRIIQQLIKNNVSPGHNYRLTNI